jgi:hypothetical protein
MAAVDQLLIDPSARQLQEAVRAAMVAANRNQGRTGRVRFPPDDLAAALDRILADPEGGRVWEGLPGQTIPQVVIVAAWWTDYIGRKHVRLYGSDHIGQYYNAPPLRPGPDTPPLACVYQRYTLFRERAGNRQLVCVCPCGASGLPEEVRWMGSCCGVCHDRAAAGEAVPQMFAPLVAPGTVWSLAVTPDGGILAAREDYVGKPGVVTLWDLAARQPVAREEAPGCLRVACSPAGDWLAWSSIGTQGPSVTVRPLNGGNERAFPGAEFAFLPGAASLVVAVYGKQLIRYDLKRKARHALARLPGLHVRDLACAPDGRTLAAACGPDGVILWDLEAGTECGRVSVPGDARHLAYHPDGHTLVVLLGGGLALMDATLTLRSSASTSGEPAHPVISPLAAAVFARLFGRPAIHAWDTRTGALRGTLDFPDYGVTCLAGPADGTWLTAGCGDRTIRFIPAEVLRG